MAEWVLVGDNILNVEQIEWVERIYDDKGKMSINVSMASGKVIEVTNTVALTLWKYIDSERLKFLSLENPERDFSGT